MNSASPNGFTDVRITDRDVILVRTELADKFSGAASGHYTAQLTVPSAVGPITFTRGWASIDYRHDANRMVKIIDTHLETEAGPTAQVAQGEELLGLVANSPNVVRPRRHQFGRRWLTDSHLREPHQEACRRLVGQGAQRPRSVVLYERIARESNLNRHLTDRRRAQQGSLDRHVGNLDRQRSISTVPCPTLGIGSFWRRRATGISEIEQPKALCRMSWMRGTAGMKGKPSGSVALSRASATARPTARHDGRARTPDTSPAAPSRRSSASAA